MRNGVARIVGKKGVRILRDDVQVDVFELRSGSLSDWKREAGIEGQSFLFVGNGENG